ncbi:helix-turn-helix transcriptional regulator [Paeniglutamicibacter gangotriensis]|uniref:Transcriptional regulator n=1 Tax=Paeniglutamicibacter gangotriensis Lz1y TaxID=1276920 RepID=M7MRV2_9MICC|nr:helix-turn-helix domain-containing protein [Paeniglutamicibacter gangotriensis]EMQ97670.1 transcriptional regulator [Paeniglutamicibacter gangotriensis Lz1y]
METVSVLGLEIRRARKDAGLTQGELADLAEVSERTVRALETATGNPSLRAVASVLNVLGLKLGVGR